MGELNAVLGVHQLRRLPEFLSVRRRMAGIYRDRLETVQAVTQLIAPPSSSPNFYKFVCFLNRGVSRSELKAALRRDYDISLSGEVYETPCHLQPVFQDLHVPTSGNLARSADVCARHICLPIYSDMTESEVDYVLDGLRRTVS